MNHAKAGILLGVAFYFVANLPQNLMAQSPPAPPGSSSSSRQDRIREHQDRIQKIIEDSRKRREAQQQATQNTAGTQPPAAPGTTPAGTMPGSITGGSAPPFTNARPGQPLPTGPVQARVTPAAHAAQTPAATAQAPQGARSESRTIMLFHPIDSIVAVGERFKTDVVAETKEGEIDEISFLLKYPRQLLNPLGLDHSRLDKFVKDKIDYEFNPDEGTIYIHAKLKKPSRFSLQPVTSIIWEALEPTDGATISYEFGEQKTTGLFLKGSNLLGTLPGADDGVIKTTVQVIAPKSKPTVTSLPDKGLLIGANPPNFVDDRPQETVSFSLKPSKSLMKSGETFNLDVYVNNPGEELMDRVRLYLQFDPEELQVVDRDAGNIVTRGTNIYDAKAREEFPFDYYRYNYADNQKGLIVYEVSASNSSVRGNGKIATIEFKALKEVSKADIVLVRNAAGMVPTTDVNYLGQSLLITHPGEQAEPLKGTTVAIRGEVSVEEAEKTVAGYNPFESKLAQRMRSKNLE